MKYLLGSSFFDGGREFRRDMARVWHWNTLAARPTPSRIVIVAEGGSKVPIKSGDMDVIELSGDLGHIGSHLNGSKKHEFTGWSASMCALAMIAYVDEADFIYKEEDCLAFGPWVEQMYADLGPDGDLVFGQAHRSPPWMECSQSLFLIRHRFIPQFVSMYLAMGKDGDVNNLGERKFTRMEERLGSTRIRRLTFGVDRERPLPFAAPVWYCQQLKSDELNQLKQLGLI